MLAAACMNLPQSGCKLHHHVTSKIHTARLTYLCTCSVLMSSLLLYQLLEESQMWTSKRYFSCALFSQLNT
jgi:hypothetical protein